MTETLEQRVEDPHEWLHGNEATLASLVVQGRTAEYIAKKINEANNHRSQIDGKKYLSVDGKFILTALAEERNQHLLAKYNELHPKKPRQPRKPLAPKTPQPRQPVAPLPTQPAQSESQPAFSPRDESYRPRDQQQYDAARGSRDDSRVPQPERAPAIDLEYPPVVYKPVREKRKPRGSGDAARLLEEYRRADESARRPTPNPADEVREGAEDQRREDEKSRKAPRATKFNDYQDADQFARDQNLNENPSTPTTPEQNQPTQPPVNNSGNRSNRGLTLWQWARTIPTRHPKASKIIGYAALAALALDTTIGRRYGLKTLWHASAPIRWTWNVAFNSHTDGKTSYASAGSGGGGSGDESPTIVEPIARENHPLQVDAIKKYFSSGTSEPIAREDHPLRKNYKTKKVAPIARENHPLKLENYFPGKK